MDGKVLTGMFDQSYLDANPISWEEVQASRRGQGSELSDEESKIVEERLKALGIPVLVGETGFWPDDAGTGGLQARNMVSPCESFFIHAADSRLSWRLEVERG